jgi:hypothetical protein
VAPLSSNRRSFLGCAYPIVDLSGLAVLLDLLHP